MLQLKLFLCSLKFTVNSLQEFWGIIFVEEEVKVAQIQIECGFHSTASVIELLE